MSNERTAEEWGRVAVGLPGWRWMPGMGCINPGMPQMWCRRIGDECSPHYSFLVPDTNDPATAGCLAQLGYDAGWLVSVKCDQRRSGPMFTALYRHNERPNSTRPQTSPGRAVAMAAIARGTWL